MASHTGSNNTLPIVETLNIRAFPMLNVQGNLQVLHACFHLQMIQCIFELFPSQKIPNYFSSIGFGEEM